MTFSTVEHTFKSARHTTGYLACGAEAAPPLIFVHGWPELSLSWRHQLPAFAALGFRCIAPDMRGYGRSSTYERHEDFAQELIVADMLELLASLGHQHAVWIGHDCGSPVVWNLAAHHPEKCIGVASLCVPYLAAGLIPPERRTSCERSEREACPRGKNLVFSDFNLRILRPVGSHEVCSSSR